MAVNPDRLDANIGDDSSPSSGTAHSHVRQASQEDDGVEASSGKAKNTLKRGDACLYCRRRRIRCTAEKPSCTHCVKVGKVCEYDNGKPKSRVKQLEEKINELESRLMTKSQPAPSFTGPTAPGPWPVQTAEASFSNSSDSVDVAMGGNNAFSSSVAMESQAVPTFPTFHFADMISADQPVLPSNSAGIAPNMLYNPPSSGPMTEAYQIPRGFHTPLPDDQVQFDFSFLDTTMMDLSSGFGNVDVQPLAQSSPSPPGLSSSSPSTSASTLAPQTDIGASFFADLNSGPSTWTSSASEASRLNPTGYAGGPMYDTRFMNKQSETTPLNYSDENTILGHGGMNDPNDIPAQARDHLLDMFFSRRRLFGFETSIPRFYASLTLPPSRRPHPCLLNAMYLMAARTSSSPAINALEKRFFVTAVSQLDEALTKSDRLFDALRAATLICVYQYSHARYHQAWVSCGTAVRLVYSTGLNAIPSSVWKPSKIPSDLAGLMRVRDNVLPPPADSVELAERIFAFWAVFSVDRAGSTSTTWPNGIPDSEITTPFPRPFIEYELGLVSRQDDKSIASIYEPCPISLARKPIPDSIFTSTIKAMSILDRASKLVYLKPEKGGGAYTPLTDAFSPKDESPPGYGVPKVAPYMRTARIRTPEAYASLKAAVDRFTADLPADRRSPWEDWAGKVDRSHLGTLDPKVAQLHFILGAAEMFMYDVCSYNHENTEALAVARRMVAVIYLVNQQRMADLGIVVVMLWSAVCKLLIREVKRLQSLGDVFAAAAIEAEVELVVDALRRMGQTFGIASMQAMRMNEYMKSDLADYKFMEGDGYWEDASDEEIFSATGPLDVDSR